MHQPLTTLAKWNLNSDSNMTGHSFFPYIFLFLHFYLCGEPNLMVGPTPSWYSQVFIVAWFYLANDTRWSSSPTLSFWENLESWLISGLLDNTWIVSPLGSNQKIPACDTGQNMNLCPPGWKRCHHAIYSATIWDMACDIKPYHTTIILDQNLSIIKNNSAWIFFTSIMIWAYQSPEVAPIYLLLHVQLQHVAVAVS